MLRVYSNGSEVFRRHLSGDWQQRGFASSFCQRFRARNRTFFRERWQILRFCFCRTNCAAERGLVLSPNHTIVLCTHESEPLSLYSTSRMRFVAEHERPIMELMLLIVPC
jgi:hypothetical protein